MSQLIPLHPPRFSLHHRLLEFLGEYEYILHGLLEEVRDWLGARSGCLLAWEALVV
jgi:hypothetical protein